MESNKNKNKRAYILYALLALMTVLICIGLPFCLHQTTKLDNDYVKKLHESVKVTSEKDNLAKQIDDIISTGIFFLTPSENNDSSNDKKFDLGGVNSENTNKSLFLRCEFIKDINKISEYVGTENKVTSLEFKDFKKDELIKDEDVKFYHNMGGYFGFFVRPHILNNMKSIKGVIDDLINQDKKNKDEKIIALGFIVDPFTIKVVQIINGESNSSEKKIYTFQQLSLSKLANYSLKDKDTKEVLTLEADIILKYIFYHFFDV